MTDLNEVHLESAWRVVQSRLKVSKKVIAIADTNLVQTVFNSGDLDREYEELFELLKEWKTLRELKGEK